MDPPAQPHRPAVRLGVDFGDGTLVIGISGPEGSRYRTAEFPGWSREMPGATGGPVAVVPVLVHYGPGGVRTIGEEVVQAGTSDHSATARWIRAYLLEESPVRIPAGPELLITYREAAADFLGAVLARTVREVPGITSVVFSMPPEAPEWYAGWLGTIARNAGILSCHTVGEHAATAAGYGLSVEKGRMVFIIRFDETNLEVSVIRQDEAADPSPSAGLRAAGHACDDTGCRALDGWIAQDILSRHRVQGTGTAQRMHDRILGSAGSVYSQLAGSDEAALDITDPRSGTEIPARISRNDIGRIIAEHGFAAVLDRTIDRARAAACSRGCRDDPPVAVLMTGRGCMVPAVQDLVRSRFAGIPVLYDHPFDAAARGAAFHQPPAGRPERIRNDYALRYWDPASREHRYRFIVRNGARYPSAGQVARITISASYDGQIRLGIPLYEISTAPDAHTPALELVSDPAGGVRLAGPAEDAGATVTPVLVNGKSPTLLAADPPAVKGEPRFELTFVLDRERQLCVTARDLVTGTLVKKDMPVHRLT